MLKRNQIYLDQCLEELLQEHQFTCIIDLLTLSPKRSLPSIDIPRYVRINLLKTSSKNVRLALKEISSFRKLKTM